MIDKGEGAILYPLKFITLPKEKVWGGHKIAARFQPELPADRRIGEVWLIWDQLAVANGPQRGRILADLVRAYPRALLGSRLATAEVPVFPLLVKILDAQENLSVQVHPDDAYAQQHEGEPFGKVEMWYILDVEPGACLIRGVREPLSPADVREAIEAGRLQDRLDQVPVAPGDVIYNPAGTIHALCSGLLLFELQQSSDLTYRLYDWDRRDPDRPLHVDKSLDVAWLDPYPAHKIQPVEIEEPGATRTYLCACTYFAAELLTVRQRLQESPAGNCFHILTVLQGEGKLCYGTGLAEEVALHGGESLLVPAGLDSYELRADTPLVLIKGYVPDLQADVIQPMRARGVAEERILQLGGSNGPSDLARHIG